MQVLNDLSALDHSRPIALVPTMGALHAGHAALIEKAREITDSIVVSIFVNPLQFEDSEDLAKYPRSPERDIELARSAGASVVWMPEKNNFYPANFEVIPSPIMGEKFEGAQRRGHFSGVLTAVNALFTQILPRYAIFGEKDFQQLFLVRQLVRERNMDIEVVGVPTVRDAEGLALSSRNARLSEVEREAALIINQALCKAMQKESLSEAKFSLVKTLSKEPLFTLDYAAIVDEDTFELATQDTVHKRALVAGWINGIRLIDNMAMTSVEQ